MIILNKIALLAWVVSTTVAQTPAPSTAVPQSPLTTAPSSLGTQQQGTPAPTSTQTSAGTSTQTSIAPTPVPVPATPSTNSPTRSLGRDECNICGEGTNNMIGEVNAVINFPDPDDPEINRRFPCIQLQNLVNTRNIFEREDVCEYIFQYTYAACRCTTPEGDLLSDVLVPTTAPAEGGDGAEGGGDNDSGAGRLGDVVVLTVTIAYGLSLTAYYL